MVNLTEPTVYVLSMGAASWRETTISLVHASYLPSTVAIDKFTVFSPTLRVPLVILTGIVSPVTDP